MLWSNIAVKSEEKVCDFGTIYQINVGEEGRGRKLMSVTCPEGLEITNGYNTDVTVGVTRSGKPRFDKKTSGDLYVLISTEHGYTRRGDGIVFVLNGCESAVEVLARGNGADGDAGRIGSWDCMLIKITADAVIRIRYSGYTRPSDIIIAENGTLKSICQADIEAAYDAMDKNLPFEISDRKINREQWARI